MKRIALALSLCGLFACGLKQSPELDGKWVGTHTEGVTAERQAAANDFARRTVVEFAGQAMAVRTPKAVHKSLYGVVGANDDDKHFTVTTEADRSETHEFELIDSQQLRWKILPDAAIVLRRQL